MSKVVLKYKHHILFFIIFTLCFVVVKSLFLYFLPFIIGMAITFLMYPVYSFMKQRLSFKPAFSATVITLFIFSIVISATMYLLYLLIKESINLYNNNLELFDRLLDSIDISKTLAELNISTDIFSKISDTAVTIVRIIPISITLIIISFVSTITFINHLPEIKYNIILKLPIKNRDEAHTIFDNAKSMLKKFVRTYLVLYLLTFIESMFVFTLIDLDYRLVFAFLATVSDLLPILGPGTVYLPIAVVKVLSHEYLSAITLVIFWGIVIVIRQIIEPKLVSDTIKIHPLIILSALYFSIVSSNIWVLFYITIITISYKILVESQVLSPLFERKNQDNDK